MCTFGKMTLVTLCMYLRAIANINLSKTQKTDICNMPLNKRVGNGSAVNIVNELGFAKPDGFRGNFWIQAF